MKYPALLLPWLTLAAVADWLIGRTLTRFAIFIPKPPPVILIYQALNLAGQLAVTLVALLSFGTLAWIIWREWQTRQAIWLPLILLSQIGFSLIFLLTPPDSWSLVGRHLVSFIAAGLIAWYGFRAENQGWVRRAALLLPALAFLAGKLYQLIPALYVALHWPGPPPLAETLFNLGELWVVLGAGGVWLVYGRDASRRVWLIAVLPALIFSISYLINPALTGILAVWSMGLTLYLPWPLYALSLWLAGVAVLVSLQRTKPAGWAILMLAAGGYAAQLSTQEFLSLIALWLLAESVPQPAARPQVVLPQASFSRA